MPNDLPGSTYLLDNFSTQGFWLQLSVLAACSGLGWTFGRLLRQTFLANGVIQPVVQIGLRSFGQVFTPLLTLCLVVVCKLFLAKWGFSVPLLQLAIPLLTAFVMMRFAFYVLQRIFVRDSGVSAIVSIAEKLFGSVLWLGVLLYISGLWPDVVAYLKNTTLPIGRSPISLLDISQVLLTILITLGLALWMSALIEERVMGLSTMHSSLRTVMARMARAFLILVAILLSLSLAGIDLTVLSIFGGAFGVALGLGLQKIASSFVSGFVILLERSLSIGDMVGVDQYYGKVTQINSRYTVLEALDGVESVVPNDLFMNHSVQNYSLTQPLLRLSTKVTIAYVEDIGRILTLLEDTVAPIPRVSHLTRPAAVLLKIGPDGLDLEIGFWIVDPENGRLNVISDVNRAIWKTLLDHDITVAQVKRDIRLSYSSTNNPSTLQESTTKAVE